MIIEDGWCRFCPHKGRVVALDRGVDVPNICAACALDAVTELHGSSSSSSPSTSSSSSSSYTETIERLLANGKELRLRRAVGELGVLYMVKIEELAMPFYGASLESAAAVVLEAVAPRGVPAIYPCGCSRNKVGAGLCDLYKPGEVPDAKELRELSAELLELKRAAK